MWHIKKDFNSLFSRNTDHFAVIDGLRSISCLMIISIHLISFLSTFIPPYPHAEWFNYLKSFSFCFTPILLLSLETFFVISGFLLTYKFLCQWNELKSSKEFFQLYPTYILRRACRYWPGILLISVIILLFGEIKANYVSMWLFFQNCVSMDTWSITMGPLWSVSLDMQIHIILPLILFLIYSSRNSINILYSLYILVILSIIYMLLLFDPKSMNIIPIISKYNTMSILMLENSAQWINTRYNITFPIIKLHPNPVKLYMEHLYFPFFSRYSSFIIGAILAVKLINIKQNRLTRMNIFKKYLYFILIWSYMFILVLPPPINDDGQLLIDDWIVTIFTCCSRQLFAICQAFILFSVICPISHPYHSSILKTILSLQIWSPIAKLSYLIYVIHFRVAFELIMMTQPNDINSSSIDYLTLFYLVLVFSICIPITSLWHIFVEKPFERYIHRMLNHKIHQN
ncbi:hypothetical protein I4U23_017293 [Adineta vaga]|nr:hypothetical protein I4U23_017293 [Adineta vaga]